MQYHRLLLLDVIIGDGKFPDIKKLSYELECGPRQIHRDLRDLKEFGDRTPIYSKARKGYYYPEPPAEPLASVLGLLPSLGKTAAFHTAIDRHDRVSIRIAGDERIMEIAPIALCAPGKVIVLVAAELPSNQLQVLTLSKVQILEVKPRKGVLPRSVQGRLMSDFVQWMHSSQPEMAFSE